MKRISKQTSKYIHTMYKRDLFKDLVKNCTPTTTIASLSNRICRNLPERRKITLRNMIMKWTLDEAEANLKKDARNNTKTWRENISILRDHGVNRRFQRVWEDERKRYKTRLQKQKQKKIQFLKYKYRRKTRSIPDEEDGIIIRDQDIPDNFSTEPRIYGGVDISEAERQLLSLPPKFAMYDEVNSRKCETEVEKALTKLR